MSTERSACSRVADRLGELLGVEVRWRATWSVSRRRPRSTHSATVTSPCSRTCASSRVRSATTRSWRKRLASFADVYVNDAFGAAHRAHASTEGVAHLLPAVAGYLMARELDVLGGVLDNPRRPLVAVLGGAKISTKLGVLTNLLDRVDSLHLGGAMACTFYRARGGHGPSTGRGGPGGGRPRRSRDSAAGWPRVLRLPSDVVVAAEASEGPPPRSSRGTPSRRPHGGRRRSADRGRDRSRFHGAATVIWNGPLGIYEVEASRAARARWPVRWRQSRPSASLAVATSAPPSRTPALLTGSTSSALAAAPRSSSSKGEPCPGWRPSPTARRSSVNSARPAAPGRGQLEDEHDGGRGHGLAGAVLDAAGPTSRSRCRPAAVPPPLGGAEVLAVSPSCSAPRTCTGRMPAPTQARSRPLCWRAGVTSCWSATPSAATCFGETDEETARKFARGASTRARVIVAVGETKQERDAGDTFAVVDRQLDAVLDGARPV